MKSTFNTFLFFALFIFVKCEAVCQPLFSLNPDYFHVTPSSDTLAEFEEFWGYSQFDVVPDDTIFVKWKVYGQETCPDGWRFIFYDTHGCYMSPFTGEYFTSNIDSAIGIYAPMPLGGINTGNNFNVAVIPNEITGCCQLRIEFSLVEEPDNIIEVANYDFEILDASCFTFTNIENARQEQVVIAPNPANSRFHFSAQNPIVSARLLDAMGNIVTDFNQIDDSEFVVADLPNGPYFLQVKLQNGHIVNEKIVVQH